MKKTLIKKTLTFEDLKTLWNAHDVLRGTKDYQKYLMQNEWKHKFADGSYSNWKFAGWYIPYSIDEAIVKRVGDNVYIMSKEPDFNGTIDRWLVTEEVNELLNIW